MNARIWRKATGSALAVLASLALGTIRLAAHQQDSSQQQSGDAVADAARKAREQKKKETAKPKKVYTDDDITHGTGGVTSATATNPAMPGEQNAQGDAKNAQAQGKEGEKTAEPAESPETKWRKRFKEAYANLDRAEKELDILQREVNKASTQYYSDPQKAMAEQYSRKDINEKDAKIAAKKKEVDQLKERIRDMEDQLRKDGGDPGWAAP